VPRCKAPRGKVPTSKTATSRSPIPASSADNVGGKYDVDFAGPPVTNIQHPTSSSSSLSAAGRSTAALMASKGAFHVFVSQESRWPAFC
jgi:hypothetical protein